MSKKITHICWDFDGTLYDTYGQIAQAMEKALGQWGQAVPLRDMHRLLKQSVYHAACVLAERFALPLGELLEAFHRHHGQVKRFHPYEGAEPCLTALQEGGCRHYLYTHRDSGAVRQLRADGLASLFSDCVTKEDGFADKPAPDALLALCGKHGFPPGEAVMVGDRGIDVQAGLNAGMYSILFDPDGFYPREPAHWHVRRLADIPPLLLGNGPLPASPAAPMPPMPPEP